MKIKEIERSDRPRERLINSGVKSLSNSEILSCILKDGTRNMNVKEISEVLLSRYRLQDLRYITLPELLKIKGIGISKACSLLSSIELANRLNMKIESLDNTIFESTNDVYEYFKAKIGYEIQEVFYVVYLEAKNMIIKSKELFKGTLNTSLVHPREIFKEAYLSSAVSVILVHNHPSGSVVPSSADYKLTKRIIEAGDLLGIKVVDHIVVSRKSYYSFYENGDI